MLTRWLLSNYAKNIGTLYLMFGIFTGLLGTAFSVFMRLELSRPSSQFLAGDHQLSNVMITSQNLTMICFISVLFMGVYYYVVSPELKDVSYWMFTPAIVLFLANVSVEQETDTFFYIFSHISLFCVGYVCYYLISMEYFTVKQLFKVIAYLVFAVLIYQLILYIASVDKTLMCREEISKTNSNANYRQSLRNIVREDIKEVAKDVGQSTRIWNSVRDGITGIGAMSWARKVRMTMKASPAVKGGRYVAMSGGAVASVKLGHAITQMEGTETVSEALNKVGKRLPPRPESPGPSDPFMAPSIYEPDAHFLTFLPEWIQQDLAKRVPSGTLSSTGDYNLLFTKYNLLVYLMVFCILLIFIGFVFLWLLNMLKDNKVYLVRNYPKTLGKLSSSRWLNFNIICLQTAITLSSLVIVNSTFFMFNNFIPGDLGRFCDEMLKK